MVKGQPAVGVTVAVLAVLVGSMGLLHPPLVRWIFVGWMMAVFPIGWLVSRVVLAGVFYGCFTPLAFLFRLMGRDPLGLSAPP